MNYVIKVKYEDTLRRLTYPGDRPHGERSGILTFKELDMKIRDLFKIPLTASIRLTYTDKDNDIITMGDDQDLDDACVFQGLNPLRVNVTLVEDRKSGSRATGQDGEFQKRDYDAGKRARKREDELMDFYCNKGSSNSAVMSDLRYPGPSDRKSFAEELKRKYHLQVPPAKELSPRELAELIASSPGPHDQKITEDLLIKLHLPPVKEASPREIVDLIDSVVHTVTTQIEPQSKVAPGGTGLKAGTDKHVASSSPVEREAVAPVSDVKHSSGVLAKAEVPVVVTCPLNLQFPTISPVTGDSSLSAACADGEPGVPGRVFHGGVQCDGCGMNPIVGPRFKSIKKEDYDLCINCWKSFGTANEYHRIDRPLFRPRHLRGPGLSSSFHSGRVGVTVRAPYGKSESSRLPVHGFGGGKLDARFVQDVTIFDGTELAPLTPFTKVWRLRNSGTLYWPKETRLVHVGGDVLGNTVDARIDIPEGGLAPGSELEVAVDLTTPEKCGRYVSHWRLASPAGPKFGHRVWVLIQVVVKDVATELPPACVIDLPAAICGTVPDGDLLSLDSGFKRSALLGSNNSMFPGLTLFLAEEYPKDVGLSHPQERDREVTNPEEDDSATWKTRELGLDGSILNTGTSETGRSPSELEVESDVSEVSSSASDSPKTDVDNKLTERNVCPTNYEHPVGEEASFVSSELGGFSLVDMPKQVPSLSAASSLGTDVKPGAGPEGNTVNGITFTSVDIVAAEGQEMMSEKLNTDFEGTIDANCEELVKMGFKDRELNVRLLERNNNDLQRTIDEFLFAAAEWDTLLDELEEMGFYDSEMNRRLMFKNNGSVKRVVKELVQMYKEPLINAEGEKEKQAE